MPSPITSVSRFWSPRDGQIVLGDAGFLSDPEGYLAYIHLYRKLHRQGPAEADMVQYFRVSPPSVHQMIVKLEQMGLITKESGVPRSVRVAITVGEIPDLEDTEE